MKKARGDWAWETNATPAVTKTVPPSPCADKDCRTWARGASYIANCQWDSSFLKSFGSGSSGKNDEKTKKRLAKRTENGKLGLPSGRIKVAKNEGIIGQAAGKTASFSREEQKSEY